MDIDDEDVDLEHTELYRHSRWAESAGVENDTGPRETVSKTKGERQKWHFCERAVRLLKLISPWNYLSTPDGIESFNDEFYRTIVGSSILVEEDALFLGAVIPDGADPSIATNCSAVSSLPLMRLSLPLLPAITLASATVLFPAATQRYLRLPSGVVCATVVAGSAGLHLLSALALLRRWRRRRCLLSRLREFVAASEGFIGLARKCLRFMQELEVIGRGLLLVTPLSAADKLCNSNIFPSSSPIPSACRCSGLRQCLTEEVVIQFRLMRDATIQLISLCPLRRDIDNPGHFIAFSTEEDLLATSKTNDNGAGPSDNFATAEVRSICQLYSVQISEFMRRLGSSFVPEFANPKSESDIGNEIVIRALPSLLERITHLVGTSTDTLAEAYRFQQLISSGRDRPSPEHRPMSDVISTDARDAYRMALRSLSLHLQVGLARVQELTDKHADIEHTSAQVTAPSGDVVLFSEEQFRAIRHDLESCRDCLDESELRFRKLYNIIVPIANLSVGHLVNSVAVAPVCTIIPLTGKTDIAPADQIFEAYVDFSDKVNDPVDESWDNDALIKSREAHEVANRMFRELKVALVPKAEEWHEREARALGVPPSEYQTFDHVAGEQMGSDLSEAERLSNGISDRRTVDSSAPPANSQYDSSHRSHFSVESMVPGAQNSSSIKLENASLPTASFAFPASIAATAAARGRILNAQSIRDSDIYKDGGEEYFGSDDEDSSDDRYDCG